MHGLHRRNSINDPGNPRGRKGTDTVPFAASATAASPETWVQAISKGIVQPAKVGATRVVSVMNVPSELPTWPSPRGHRESIAAKGSVAVPFRPVPVVQLVLSTDRSRLRAASRLRNVRSVIATRIECRSAVVRVGRQSTRCRRSASTEGWPKAAA